MFNLLPYVDRCALIRVETCETCVMFIFDILSDRVNSSNFLSLISINAPWYVVPHLDGCALPPKLLILGMNLCESVSWMVYSNLSKKFTICGPN
jgi:hypothetical protein